MCVFALKGEFEGEGDGVGGCEREGGGWLEVFDGGLFGKKKKKRRLVFVGNIASVKAFRGIQRTPRYRDAHLDTNGPAPGASLLLLAVGCATTPVAMMRIMCKS